jgi:hypothetical protein
VVIISIGLLFAGLGLLGVAVYVLAVLTVVTTVQRVAHVRRALNAPAPPPAA